LLSRGLGLGRARAVPKPLPITIKASPQPSGQERRRREYVLLREASLSLAVVMLVRTVPKPLPIIIRLRPNKWTSKGAGRLLRPTLFVLRGIQKPCEDLVVFYLTPCHITAGFTATAIEFSLRANGLRDNSVEHFILIRVLPRDKWPQGQFGRALYSYPSSPHTQMALGTIRSSRFIPSELSLHK
jgi:hypothetical protein